MADTISRAGLGGSLVALLAASSCCVLPMSLMIAGLGGSWMAVFAPLSAASPYVLGLSAGLLAIAWVLALRRKASRRTLAMLSTGTVLALTAWLLLVYDERLTMFFLSYM